MKILKIDQRNNFFDVVPESLDDLWHLQRVIEEGDIVKGKSDRKIKGKEEGEKASRKEITVELKVEKVEFHEFSGKLRVQGIIVAGYPEEFVELKSHHSLDLETRKRVQVKKEKLKNYQVDRLEKARKASGREKLLVVVLDDEEASIALVKEFGFEEKTRLSTGKQGKMFEGEKSNYLEEVVKKIAEVKPEKLLVAGPGFTKDKLKKLLEEKKPAFKMFFETTNSVGPTGLNELIKTGKLDRVSSEIQLSKETQLVEELLSHISKGDGLAEYGEKEVENALNLGAIQKLLVSDEKLLNEREKVEKLLEQAEKLGAEVHIVSAEHDAGKQLKGFGGIAALLRYKVS